MPNNDELKAIVLKYIENYKAQRPDLPSPETFEDVLLMCGPPEEMKFACIPIDSPDIVYFGSACGRSGNRIFSEQNIITFLKSAGVKHIFATVDPDWDATYVKGAIGLLSLALPFTGKLGRTFERLVNKAGGSFRYDTDGRVEYWSFYESE